MFAAFYHHIEIFKNSALLQKDKMGKHLKRLTAPRTWKIERKVKKWAVKPSPGPHPIERSLPLSIILRDYLGYCDSLKEAKHIIGSGEVFVDRIHRKNHKFPCGFMDSISFPKMEENFRILLDRKGVLRLIPISKEEAEWKLCRIENKRTVKKGKNQLNLHDGRNILNDGEYSTGDVLKISLPDQSIIDSFSLKEGIIAMIIDGKHAGEIAKIEGIEKTRNPGSNIVHLENFVTIKEYVFPIGKEKPEIKIAGI